MNDVVIEFNPKINTKYKYDKITLGTRSSTSDRNIK